MARYDDLNTGAIAYATLLSCILLLLIILLVRALTFGWIESEEQRKLANSQYVEANSEISEQLEQVARYAKVKVPASGADEPEGEDGENSGASDDSEPEMIEQIHIPVEKAKELILQELSSEAPAPEA